ncbi:unnamed protein product, partial [Urochloa humidicola]
DLAAASACSLCPACAATKVGEEKGEEKEGGEEEKEGKEPLGRSPEPRGPKRRHRRRHDAARTTLRRTPPNRYRPRYAFVATGGHQDDDFEPAPYLCTASSHLGVDSPQRRREPPMSPSRILGRPGGPGLLRRRRLR